MPLTPLITREKPMNLNVFESSSASVSVQSPRSVSSSASAQKPIQDRTNTTERTNPSIKSIVNPDSSVYWSNVLNSPLSLMDNPENSRSEAVQARNKTTSKKRLHWWL
jgi:hypothetical protein